MPLSKEQEARLAQLEAKYDRPVENIQTTVMDPAKEARLAELEAKYDAPQKEEPGLLSKALDYGGRALDYPGGLVRTGLAGAAAIASGQPGAVTTEDVSNAFKGKAPSSAQYMERLGVPEGESVDLPFLGKTSVRDVGGFAADVATDPLTAVAKGVKALRPVEGALESAGKATYKSGFKKIDERLAEKGKKGLGELLLEEGMPTGTTKTISKKAEEISNKALKERTALYDKADELGVKVNLQEAPFKSTEKVFDELRTNPRLKNKATALYDDLILPYKNEGEVSLQQLSDWKTRLYEGLPDSAFGPDGKPRGVYKRIDEALSNDFKNIIVESGNKAEKGLGDKIDKLNEKMGTTLSAKKPMQMQIRRGETTNMVTPVDAIASVADPSQLMLGAKKAADLSKTTYARTKLGKGLMKASKVPMLDSQVRRGLLNANSGLMEEEQ